MAAQGDDRWIPKGFRDGRDQHFPGEPFGDSPGTKKFHKPSRIFFGLDGYNDSYGKQDQTSGD
jgi:hypothetical protein